ncbi:hypothetical protein [Propionivibrio sp.]|uniref:hypothetical protein n=1 Tax=Propionivibrio sp. TaxID=2212460 RepID=UPI003BF0E619
MKAPKILPWVARKAGISDELALRMWRRAAGEAEEMTGCCNSSDYYRLAVERFIDLSEEEGEKYAERGLPKNCCVSRIWRYQKRLSQGNLLAAQKICRLWLTSWESLVTGHKQAA